ncbi:g5193 [Coccomyxa elongata]
MAPKYPHAVPKFSLDAPKVAIDAESVGPENFSPFCRVAVSAAGRPTDPVFGLPGRRTSGSLELPRVGSIGFPGAPDLALGQLIGRGSFGRIYKGEWQGKEVAVKVPCSQDSREANFEGLSEYLVSKKVRHPNVVDTYKVIIHPPSASQQCSRSALQPFSSESAASSGAASCRHPFAAEADCSLDGDPRFFQDCGQDSNPEPVSANGARQLAAYMAVDERYMAPPTLAGDAMAQNAAASAFAPAAALPAKAGTLHQRQYGGGYEHDQLRGLLDSTGVYVESRAATVLLAPSTFEEALERALSGSADAAAEPALQRIARSFSAGDGATAGLPAACRPAAAAERVPPLPRSGSSSVGNLTADTQSSWLALKSGAGFDGEQFPAGRSLHARLSFTGLSQLPPRPAGSNDMAAVATALVMEYADLGSLHNAISRGRVRGNLNTVLLCARDVAAGMAYLHSMDIIHSDLKPANVLLKSAQATPSDPRGFTCKIADFGMARRLPNDSGHICIDMPGSLAYMAPEVLQAGRMSKGSDVYSFAILLLELWSGTASCTDQDYYGVLYSVFCGCRPAVPADAPAGYRALIEDRWAADASLRPTFTAIHDQLAALLTAAPGK